tara:strand:- start:2859 stop:3590 length:732 start_codon:yes stop_codon:yes gene_type:complete
MHIGIDQIFAKSHAKVEDFEFNAQVAQVFPDMIQRSVPGYLQIIQSIGDIAHQVVVPRSHVYDLGCSLGAVSLSIRRRIEDRTCRLIAVDNSEAMIERAHHHIKSFKSPLEIEVYQDDIRNFKIEKASLVVLNFTLQFLHPDDRLSLLKNIYQGMLPGGVLLVSEKLNFHDTSIHQLMNTLHLDFKRTNGYSELEISQKRTAIENVMKPDTLHDHYQRFNDAGFSSYQTWFQCFNFASMVAIK